MKQEIAERAVLTVIGGGSAYAPGLVAALIHHSARVALAEVRLYDVAPERLDVVAALSQKMARAAGAPFMVRRCASLEAAVTGADLVLNSSRPGGLHARRIDEILPLELGIPGQETVGPGGFFFALRSVPAALELAAAMRTHAPQAWLLNYTNPTNIVTQALYDAGYERVVGLCDQSDEDLETLRTALGFDERAEITFDCVGLNHATWYRNVHIDGAPLDVSGAIATPKTLDAEHAMRFEVSLEMAREAGEGWPNSYLPYYRTPERFVELTRRQGPRSDAILAELDSYYDHFSEEARKPQPQLHRHRGTHGFGDLAVRTLIALRAPKPQSLVLNLPRCVAFHSEDSTVVETRVDIGRDGIERDTAIMPPPHLAALLSALERYQHLTARAASRGDNELRLEALAANPLVENRDVAQTLLNRARERYAALPEAPFFLRPGAR